jgi:lactoylglutathione lyase
VPHGSRPLLRLRQPRSGRKITETEHEKEPTAQPEEEEEEEEDLDFSVCLPLLCRYRSIMSKAKKLLHTRYRVNDLDKTVAFYRDVLGLQEVRRSKSPRGSELVFVKAPGSEELIELCYFPSSGPVQVQPDLTHLAFEVDSLQEFGKHLASKGLSFSDGPHMKPDGGGIAFVDAPEGYEIELIEMAKKGPGY